MHKYRAANVLFAGPLPPTAPYRIPNITTPSRTTQPGIIIMCSRAPWAHITAHCIIKREIGRAWHHPKPNTHPHALNNCWWWRPHNRWQTQGRFFCAHASDVPARRARVLRRCVVSSPSAVLHASTAPPPPRTVVVCVCVSAASDVWLFVRVYAACTRTHVNLYATILPGRPCHACVQLTFCAAAGVHTQVRRPSTGKCMVRLCRTTRIPF